jgi:hypothetical protein
MSRFSSADYKEIRTAISAATADGNNPELTRLYDSLRLGGAASDKEGLILFGRCAMALGNTGDVAILPKFIECRTEPASHAPMLHGLVCSLAKSCGLVVADRGGRDEISVLRRMLIALSEVRPCFLPYRLVSLFLWSTAGTW